MLAKLLALLSSAKGAAAATVVATAALGGGAAATNHDVQQAITTTLENVSQQANGLAKAASEFGQPAVVKARNDADKKLRDAFKDDHQKLVKLRSTHVDGTDRQQLNTLIGEADAKLKARLTLALNDVAALTLGREGQQEDASPAPSASATPEPSPTLTPLPTSPTITGSAQPSSSPGAHRLWTAEDQAKIDAIVAAAIADMDKIAADAASAVAALPTATPRANPGKPSDVPRGKPSDVPRGKPSDIPGGKPSDVPRGGKPNDVPRGGPNAPTPTPSPSPTSTT